MQQLSTEQAPVSQSPTLPQLQDGKTAATVDRGRLSLLAVGHAVTDMYGQSLLSPMLPDIERRLSLTKADIGALPLMMGLTASLAQPLFGWVSDRLPRVCMVALGPVVAALFIGFVGHARSYWELAALMFMAGIGIGAFHPQGATLARAAGRGSSLAMSAFTVGGNVGFGLAPIMGQFFVATFGPERLYLASLPALLFAAAMAYSFYTRGYGDGRPVARAVSPAAGPGNPRALAALTGTVVIRSAVQIGIITFLPFLVESLYPQEDWTTAKSLSVSAFLLASAAAGPLGGLLADRFGRKRLMLWSFLAAPWPMLLAFQVPGGALIALLAVGAFILMLPHPGNVVLAQELMPRSAGIAASMITGLAWGLAHIAAWPLGWIAEQSGVGLTLQGLCLVPLLGAPLVFPIPARTAES
ncbi:MAG: MFS transporter [Armatimonadota bacterium]